MNKYQFEDLIRYLSNRPEECGRLASILICTNGREIGGQEESERGPRKWVSPCAAGKLLGVSDETIRKHLKIGVWPSAREVESGKKKRFLIPLDEVEKCWDLYIQRKSKKTWDC